MAGTTGLEPAASAVTVLCRSKRDATLSEWEEEGATVFMRVKRILPAFHLYPNDTLRHGQIPVGMAGLRHKPRHKFPRNEAIVRVADKPSGEANCGVLRDNHCCFSRMRLLCQRDSGAHLCRRRGLWNSAPHGHARFGGNVGGGWSRWDARSKRICAMRSSWADSARTTRSVRAVSRVRRI
jgi:hypothetical protein